MRTTGVDRVKALMTAGRSRLSSEQAFSIVELLVATLLLFVITFGIINFADEGASLAKASVSSAEVNQEWRENMDAMTRQVRVAYYFESATGTAVSFVSYAKGDNVKYNVAYRLTESNLETSVVALGTTKSWSTMAQGVESLTFRYYAADGSELTAPVDTLMIARVDISMRIGRSYAKTVGTSSEGHRLELDNTTLKAEGAESVTIRNVLTEVP